MCLFRIELHNRFVRVDDSTPSLQVQARVVGVVVVLEDRTLGAARIEKVVPECPLVVPRDALKRSGQAGVQVLEAWMNSAAIRTDACSTP